MEPPLKASAKTKQGMAKHISAAKATSMAKSGKPEDSSQPMIHVEPETQKTVEASTEVGTSLALPKHPATVNIGTFNANHKSSSSVVSAKAQDTQGRRSRSRGEVGEEALSLPQAPQTSPSRSKVNELGPSGPPSSPRNGASSSSESGESNEDQANDMSNDLDSPSPVRMHLDSTPPCIRDLLL
ncbi:hypothetical protein NL676_038438 [Syzygium grande]|nr:hypothetical protein NL676_038438 [Syzygium grande]